jgi:Flp pilus assembly protein TadG
MMNARPSRRPPRDRERGVAAVEFAIVSILFFTLVMGTLEWGWFFFVHQRVVNAAREGARAGTLLPPPPTSTAEDAELAARTAAEDYLQRVLLQRRGVTATWEAIGAGGGVDAIRVQIDYPVEPLTGFFSGMGLLPTHARATSVMRWQ